MSYIYRWIDNTDKTLEQSINAISSSHNISNKKYANIYTTKNHSQNVSMSYLNHEVIFNSFSITYDDLSQSTENRTKHCSVIVYTVDKSKVYYITEHHTDFSLLRLLFRYNGRKEIELKSIDFNSDMLMWLVYKAYNNDNTTQISPYKSIELTQLIGIQGSTDDKANKVKTEGRYVLKIISTLAFILESRDYRNASIQLSYGNHHNIDITMWNNGKISISHLKYYGLWGDNKAMALNEKLAILMFLEILPLLEKWYNNDIENHLWSPDKQVAFLKQVADDVKVKIEKKIKATSEYLM